MRFFKHLILVNDTFYISEEIKNINKNYRLFYNKNLCQYEVHNITKNQSFVLCFKNYPNQNLITNLLNSGSKQPKTIFKEIEENNMKIFENNQNKIFNKANDCLNEVFKFSEKTTSDISQKQIKKIIEKG